ncbi:hypothetical protein BH23VER1_BH23VER1_07690 [soil metagenome]
MTLSSDPPPHSDAEAAAPRGYPRETVLRVWGTAQPVEGNDPDLWRKDEFGAWLNRLDYGNRHSDFGWEIAGAPSSHSSAGLASLRPMHWQNYLDQVAAATRTCITADGLRNIRQLL